MLDFIHEAIMNIFIDLLPLLLFDLFDLGLDLVLHGVQFLEVVLYQLELVDHQLGLVLLRQDGLYQSVMVLCLIDSAF